MQLRKILSVLHITQYSDNVLFIYELDEPIYWHSISYHWIGFSSEQIWNGNLLCETLARPSKMVYHKPYFICLRVCVWRIIYWHITVYVTLWYDFKPPPIMMLWSSLNDRKINLDDYLQSCFKVNITLCLKMIENNNYQNKYTTFRKDFLILSLRIYIWN